MPLCAAPCRCSQSRSCKYALLLGVLALSQAEGRRFEPGLALQGKPKALRGVRRPSTSAIGAMETKLPGRRIPQYSYCKEGPPTRRLIFPL